MRSERFGDMLKAAINSVAIQERKTNPIIEEELGTLIGVSAASIQRYKAGHLPPEAQSIEIIAKVAIERGGFGREWLKNFLHVARYPQPDKVLDRICPITTPRPELERVYQNLPAPTYNQFVMRHQAYRELVDGLNQRSAVVLIASLGGMGKTSLAREIAAKCLEGVNEVPRFDGAVWISDKDRPGTTTFSIVLDEIARTLDYPGFIQLEHVEKQYEVEQLLRRQKVLLVIDNFETITDEVLMLWLLRLPEPSKALITTREYRREFRRSSWPIDLRGMTDLEAAELINQKLYQLKIDKMITDQSQLTPLVAITGGNPKAIEIALGCVKYQRQPIQQVIDDLYAARGELFDDLFTRCWSLLDEASSRVLLSMPIFIGSASEEALSATADVTGYSFERAIERLTDLALLDVQQETMTSKPRYLLHPLVRAFTLAKLASRPNFEIVARERWILWFKELTSKFSTHINYANQLDLLELEQETAYGAIKAIFQNGQYKEAIQLATIVDHYYYVRGLWDKNLELIQIRYEAARRLGDRIQEIDFTVFKIQLLSKQANFVEAQKLITQLEKLCEGITLSDTSFYRVQHGLALFYFGQNRTEEAQEAWNKILIRSDKEEFWQDIATRRWIAACLYRKGFLEEAKQLLHEALKDALKEDYIRGMVAIQNRLAEVALAQGELETASSYLASTFAQSTSLQDRRNLALTQNIYAKLYLMENNKSAARSAILQAIDHFERVGMQKELTEARELFNTIEGA